jgi:hypothetical protein
VAVATIAELPIESIIVRVVEDHTALYAVLGTVGGAIVGVGGSWLQQRSKIGADRKQLEARLDAEKQRLKEQLGEEQERLDRQLAHDREMREREALRDVLDNALDAARLHLIATGDANREHAYGQKPRDRGMIGIAGSRLLIRLGRNHPVVKSYDELATAASTASHRVSQPLSSDEDPATREQECRKLILTAMTALKAFGDTAVNLCGSTLVKGP